MNVFVSSNPPAGKINFATGVSLGRGHARNLRVELGSGAHANSIGIAVAKSASVINSAIRMRGGDSSVGLQGSGRSITVDGIDILISSNDTGTGVQDLSNNQGGPSRGGTYSNVSIEIDSPKGFGIVSGGNSTQTATIVNVRRSSLLVNTAALSVTGGSILVASQSSLSAATISDGAGNTKCVASDDGSGNALQKNAAGTKCVNPVMP